MADLGARGRRGFLLLYVLREKKVGVSKTKLNQIFSAIQAETDYNRFVFEDYGYEQLFCPQLCREADYWSVLEDKADVWIERVLSENGSILEAKYWAINAKGEKLFAGKTDREIIAMIAENEGCSKQTIAAAIKVIAKNG